MRNEEVRPIWCHVAKQLHAVYIFIKENVWRLGSGRLVINGSRNIQKVKIAFIFGNLVPVWIMFRQKRVLYQTTQFDGVGRAKQIRSTSSPSLQKSEVWFEAPYDTGTCELDTKEGDDFENKSGKCSSENHGLSTPADKKWMFLQTTGFFPKPINSGNASERWWNETAKSLQPVDIFHYGTFTELLQNGRTVLTKSTNILNSISHSKNNACFFWLVKYSNILHASPHDSLRDSFST